MPGITSCGCASTTWYCSWNACWASFQFTGSRHGVPPLGAQRLDLPRVEDAWRRARCTARSGGALGVEVDPRAAAPRLAPHRHEVDVAGLEVVLGEGARCGTWVLRAVLAVAPAVERAGEPALAGAAPLHDPARRGGGRRSGRRAPRRRRCARRRTDWSRISYSTKSPGSGISSSRQAICHTRGHSCSASSAEELGIEVALLGRRGRGPRSRRAPAAVSTSSDPRSPCCSSPWEIRAGELY